MASRKGEAPATAIAGASDVTPVYHDKANNVMESTTTRKAAATKPVAPEFSADRMAAQDASRVRDLESTMTDIGRMACDALERVESLSRVLAGFLSAPDSIQSPGDAVNVLWAIVELSSDVADGISLEGERLGISFIKPA